MTNRNIPITNAGLEKLKQEQEELEMNKRPQAKQRIKRGRNFCDFNEDSEFDAALDALAAIEDRIATIQYVRQHAEIIEKTTEDTVRIGSTVTLREIPGDDIETYTIVGAEEADPSAGYISYNSPVAESILGAHLHEEVTIQLPNGTRNVVVIDIV